MLKGLLGALRGAGDQLDFIPGIDPDKDKRGLISRLLAQGQEPRNPNGLHGPTPQAQIQPPQPMDYTTRLNVLDVLNPFKDARGIRANDQARYNFAKDQYTAQQALMASQRSDDRFRQNAQAAGYDDRQIAGMSIARNHNPEKFGEQWAENYGFNTASEGSLLTQFGGEPIKAEKTYMPIDPAKLAIDQQNADARTKSAEASMHSALNPSALVQNILPGQPNSPYKPLNEYGAGEWIPPAHPMLKGVDIPDDAQIYGTGGQDGVPFTFETAPGTPTAAKEEMKDGNRTVGSMMSSLVTLNSNNAIPSMQRSNNIPGMIAQTGAGQFYDRLGTDFGGNPENAVARDSLKGLRMGALMNMISMSDVSARAMDSDAEMRAWLSAIEGDTYESALLKLHVLDSAYGSGSELDKLYADGLLDEETHKWVQDQVRNDPGVRSKLEKSQVLARVDRAVMEGKMSAEEAQELLLYEGWQIDQNTWASWQPAGAMQ